MSMMRVVTLWISRNASDKWAAEILDSVYANGDLTGVDVAWFFDDRFLLSGKDIARLIEASIGVSEVLMRRQSRVVGVDVDPYQKDVHDPMIVRWNLSRPREDV